MCVACSLVRTTPSVDYRTAQKKRLALGVPNPMREKKNGYTGAVVGHEEEEADLRLCQSMHNTKKVENQHKQHNNKSYRVNGKTAPCGQLNVYIKLHTSCDLCPKQYRSYVLRLLTLYVVAYNFARGGRVYKHF